MRRVAPFAVVALLLASAYAWTRADDVEPRQRGPLPNPVTSGAIVVEPLAPGRPAWEYRVVNVHTDRDPAGELNEAGAEGGELVAATGHPPFARYILKRPKLAAPAVP